MSDVLVIIDLISIGLFHQSIFYSIVHLSHCLNLMICKFSKYCQTNYNKMGHAIVVVFNHIKESVKRETTMMSTCDLYF